MNPFNPYVGACGGGIPYGMMVGQVPGQMAPNAFGMPTAQAFAQAFGGGGFGPGIPAGTPGVPCPGSRPATAEEIAMGLVDAGGRCYLPPPPPGSFDPRVPQLPPPPSYFPPVPGYGPCGPIAFDALALQRQAMAGVVGSLAPVTLIGLGDDCPPLLPPVPAYVDSGLVAHAATEGDICEACCSAQACFCVTKITIPNCGPCIFLLTSIKSGLCELLQCGSVMADSFYCDCDSPPLKTTMISPGIEFCITAQNVDTVIEAVDGATVAAVAAAIVARTHRFRATLYGISTDEPCRPCLY